MDQETTEETVRSSTAGGSALAFVVIVFGCLVGLALGIAVLVRIDSGAKRTTLRFLLDHERRTGSEYRFLRNVLGLELGYSERDFWDRLRARDVDAVQLLIAAGMNVNTTRDLGETPLTFAAAQGLNEFIEMFLSRGADVNGQNDRGETALSIVVDRQNRPLVERLLQKKAEVNRVRADGSSPLLIAATMDDLRLSEMLLNAGANMSYQDPEGRTALHIAVSRENVPFATMLLDRGANFNLFDARGYSPLMLAVNKKNVPLIELLVKKGADIEAPNAQGLSARELGLREGLVITMDVDRRIRVRSRGRPEGEVDHPNDPLAADLPGERIVPDASDELPRPTVRSSVEIDGRVIPVPSSSSRQPPAERVPYGIAPRAKAAQTTRLRDVGEPEAFWNMSRGLVLQRVKVKVRNAGDYEAKGVQVAVAVPGGGEVALRGPSELAPNATAEYKADPSQRATALGPLKVTLACTNCRQRD